MNGFVSCVARLVSIAVVVTIIFTACSKDEPTSSVQLDVAGAFISDWGGTGTVKFTTENVRDLKVTSKPEGWSAEVDMATLTIKVTAPAEPKDDAEKDKIKTFGNVVLSAYAYEGIGSSATLYVSMSPTVDISSAEKRSNSYIVSDKNTQYVIDATHKGESNETITPVRADIVWQSQSLLVEYVRLDQGKIYFYSKADDDDKLREGNVVIGAYNANGEVIWSWHIWIVASDIKNKTVVFNGKTFMGCNLGAVNNANSDNAEILASYGLFYQWGRKDPFIGPASYNGAKGADATIYGPISKTITTYVVCDETVGTMEYATKNPLHFIRGVEASKYDWIYSAHSNTLWGDVKSINDPCPKGWRVPSRDDFKGLTIADDLAVENASEVYANKFGWTLTDGSVSDLFIGAGRRTYLTGRLHNFYNPPMRSAMEAQPWEGLYWTNGTDTDTQSSAFYFYFNKSDVESSRVVPQAPYQRANGMNIRCVKM